jgi:choline dehydrogenase
LILYAHAMRPESKGNVHITAADPRKPPAINFNFLSSPPDAELTVRAVRIARAIMTAPAMAPLQVTEVAPGTAVHWAKMVKDVPERKGLLRALCRVADVQ